MRILHCLIEREKLFWQASQTGTYFALASPSLALLALFHTLYIFMHLPRRLQSWIPDPQSRFYRKPCFHSNGKDGDGRLTNVKI